VESISIPPAKPPGDGGPDVESISIPPEGPPGGGRLTSNRYRFRREELGGCGGGGEGENIDAAGRTLPADCSSSRHPPVEGSHHARARLVRPTSFASRRRRP